VLLIDKISNGLWVAFDNSTRHMLWAGATGHKRRYDLMFLDVIPITTGHQGVIAALEMKQVFSGDGYQACCPVGPFLM